IIQITQYHNLEHLALNFHKFLSDETIRIIVQSCPNIRYLNLEFCHTTDIVVEAIAQSCRNMEYLNIYGSESITDSSISKIAKKCSKIQKLELG
ncbi:40850_t:CDS:1, partial [Gigaspora margarita]